MISNEYFIRPQSESSFALMVEQETEFLPVCCGSSPAEMREDSVSNLRAVAGNPFNLLFIRSALRAYFVEPTWIVARMDARHSEWHQHDE